MTEAEDVRGYVFCEVVGRASGRVIRCDFNASASPRLPESAGVHVISVDQQYVHVEETRRPALENYEPAHPLLGALLNTSNPAPEVQQGRFLALRVGEREGYEGVPDEVSANPNAQAVAGLKELALTRGFVLAQEDGNVPVALVWIFDHSRASSAGSYGRTSGIKAVVTRSGPSHSVVHGETREVSRRTARGVTMTKPGLLCPDGFLGGSRE